MVQEYMKQTVLEQNSAHLREATELENNKVERL